LLSRSIVSYELRSPVQERQSSPLFGFSDAHSLFRLLLLLVSILRSLLPSSLEICYSGTFPSSHFPVVEIWPTSQAFHRLNALIGRYMPPGTPIDDLRHVLDTRVRTASADLTYGPFPLPSSDVTPVPGNAVRLGLFGCYMQERSSELQKALALMRPFTRKGA